MRVTAISQESFSRHTTWTVWVMC